MKPTLQVPWRLWAGVMAGLLAFGIARGDPLDDLRTRLDGFSSHGAIRVAVSVAREGAGGEKPVALVADSPDGLTVTWSRPLIDDALRERQAQSEDPEKPAPLTRQLDDLKATSLAGYLDAPAILRRILVGAKLTGVHEEERDGRKVRRLDCRVDERLSGKDAKMVKQIDSTAQVWVDADGVPLAAETHLQMKGRAFLVISFATQERSTFTFARVGDRLIVRRCDWENESSGAGESQKQRRTITLEPLES